MPKRTNCYHQTKSLYDNPIKVESEKPWQKTDNSECTSIFFCLFQGTHEIGGLTPIQALEIIRGCRGMNIIGGDLVEVWLQVHRLQLSLHVIIKKCYSTGT